MIITALSCALSCSCVVIATLARAIYDMRGSNTWLALVFGFSSMAVSWIVVAVLAFMPTVECRVAGAIAGECQR